MTKPYRPSNGSEGMGFCEAFCVRCAHDVDENCSILARSLAARDIADPDYPVEWVTDERGPRCAAFLASGDDPELAAARNDERQANLF